MSSRELLPQARPRQQTVCLLFLRDTVLHLGAGPAPLFRSPIYQLLICRLLLEFLPGAKSTSNFITFHPHHKPYYCALYVRKETKVADSVTPIITQAVCGRESLQKVQAFSRAHVLARLEGSKCDYVAPWAEDRP